MQLLIIGENSVSHSFYELFRESLSLPAPVSIDSAKHLHENYQGFICCLDQAVDEPVLEFIGFLKTSYHSQPIVVISVEQSDRAVANLFKAGATDYFRIDEIENTDEVMHCLSINLQNTSAISHVDADINANEKQENQTECLDYLLNECPAVIFELKIEGDKLSPVYVSHNIEMIFGIKSQDFLSEENFIEKYIHPNEQAFIHQARLLVLYNKQRSHFFRFLMPNGNYRWIQEELRLATNPRGGYLEIIGYWGDMHQHKEIEQQVFKSEERFRLSQIYAHIGTWDWDIKTGDLYWSDQIAPLFGYENGILETTYENFLAAVHEDDRQKVIDAVNDCVQNGDEYNIEHRSVWPDGTVRWILEKGDVTRGVNGEPLHMLGVVQDITDRKHLEIELEQQKKLLELSGDGLREFVSNGNFVEVATTLLDGILQITGSAYGLIGEVFTDEQEQPYLKVNALSDVHWDEASRMQYESVSRGELEFRRLDTLFGEAIKTGQVIISNEPTADPRSGGAPA